MGKSSRQLWKDYVESQSSNKPKRSVSSNRVSLSKFKGVILGIDPSLRATGMVVVEFHEGGKQRLLHSETVKVAAVHSYAKCLGEISERFDWVSDQFHIDHVAVEQTIYVQNYRTAMILGSAKGAALGVLARKGLEIFEYPPLRVKQAIVGRGRASKDQVALMVSQMLEYEGWSSADETDAAGVALCHGFTHKAVSSN